MNTDLTYSISQLISLAYDCGYYAATLEKVKLTPKERRDYERLLKEAIEQRNIEKDYILRILSKG